MGRRNKAYHKDLHQQAYDRLTGMQAFGESKKQAVADGTEKDKIFSFSTYKAYWKHVKYFIKYIQEKHPECTTLKSAKKYVNEWLQARTDQGLSAWTIQLEAKAMGKLYGISPDDENYFKPPKRNREDIKRSRGVRVRDKHFSKTNNDELIRFCKGTGLRRRELSELRGKDLVTREQIEAEISRLESRPAAELTPGDTKRLGMLQDTRLFEGDYFTHVRNLTVVWTGLDAGELKEGEQLEIQVAGHWIEVELERDPDGGWSWRDLETGWSLKRTDVAPVSVRKIDA